MAKSKPWTKEELETLYLGRSSVPLKSYPLLADILQRDPEAVRSKWRGTNWLQLGFATLDDSDKYNLKEVFKENIDSANEKRQIKQEIKTNLLVDVFEKAIESLPKVPKPTYSAKNAKHTYSEEDIGLLMSDLHIGHQHTLEDTGNISEYNYDIFKKRLNNLKLAVTDIANLHQKLYKIPRLHIFSAGDVVAGMNDVGAWDSLYISSSIVDQVINGLDSLSGVLNYWLGFFEEIHFYGISGNHGRCLSYDTFILTPDGYKSYTEIKEGSLVGTVNSDGNFEFQPVQEVHIYENELSMVGVKNNKFEMFTTKDHAVLWQDKKNNYQKTSAINIMESDKVSYKIPLKAKSNNKEYPISDNMLKVLGWIITDAGYNSKCSEITIYQSKENYVNEIRELIQSENIKYSETSRNKVTKDICNVAVMTQKQSYEFNLLSSDYVRKIRELLPIRESIPSWMYQLSDRQVQVLLETIVKGDGTFRKPKVGKDGYTRSGGMDIIWGKKEFLDQLLGLLVSHNITATVCSHKRKQVRLLKNGEEQSTSYYLQIKKSNNFWLKPKQMEEFAYGKTAWCVTVPNGTIAVKSARGNAYFTGNSSKKGVQKDHDNWDYITYKFLEVAFKNNDRIKFKIPKSWWMMETIKNHKFLMVHGDYLNKGDLPLKKLLNFERSMGSILKQYPDYTLAGHYHNAAELTTNSGKLLINGSFIGSDVYSLKEVHAASKPEQKLFGINSSHGITWSYNINLDITRKS